MPTPSPTTAQDPARGPLLMLGYANIDVIARVPTLPHDGDRVTAERIDTHFGGMAANAACAAAQEGTTPIFFGTVGEDAFGPLAIADLESRGVNTHYLSRNAPHTTKALILVTPTGERAIVSEPTAYDPEPLRAYLAQHQGSPGILYTDGYHLGWAAQELKHARDLGFRVYCDLDGAPDTYGPDEIMIALANVDIAQWSQALLERLLPDRGPGEASRQLTLHVPISIHTAGAAAVVITDAGHHKSIPVEPLPRALDTTGAGDTLAGATVAWMTRGYDVENAVKKGIEAARRSVQHRGARLP